MRKRYFYVNDIISIATQAKRYFIIRKSHSHNIILFNNIIPIGDRCFFFSSVSEESEEQKILPVWKTDCRLIIIIPANLVYFRIVRITIRTVLMFRKI